MAVSRMQVQGFGIKGIGGDLSAGLTKAIDSVTRNAVVILCVSDRTAMGSTLIYKRRHHD